MRPVAAPRAVQLAQAAAIAGHRYNGTPRFFIYMYITHPGLPLLGTCMLHEHVQLAKCQQVHLAPSGPRLHLQGPRPVPHEPQLVPGYSQAPTFAATRALQAKRHKI